MKLEDIIEEWSKDCSIDQTNISNESANISKLHNKYYVLYMQEGMKLRKIRTDMKKLAKLKSEYYRGELSQEELTENGWEQQPLKILKTDIPSYVDADEDIIVLSLRIGAQEEKVDYLESIIRQISNRGFQLKNIIDWERFRTGG